MRRVAVPLWLCGLAAPLLLGAVIAAGVGGTAHAQMDSREGIALQNEILELRHDLQDLQSQRGTLPAPVQRGGGGGGGGGSSAISAELLDRVTALEDAVRQLRGQVEELSNANRRQQEDLSKQVADLNFRLNNASPNNANTPATTTVASPRPGPAAGSSSGPTSGAGANTTTGTLGTLPDHRTPPRTPELAMQQGNAALARRDYKTAEDAAREVLAKDRGRHSIEAQFLLAQALAGKRDDADSAIAYDDAYKRAPTGPRAPEALLGLANAMLRLGDRNAACDAVRRLNASFRTLRPDVRSGEAAVRARARCG